MTRQPDQRGFNAGQFAVELDSAMAGWVQSVEGGLPQAEVVSEKIGADLTTHKHIGTIKYEEITMKCGTGMSRGFYDWVARSTSQDYLRQNGAIVTADFDYRERGRLNFHQALITEFTLPALDATSKEAASMTLKLSPEYTKRIKASGAAITGKYPTNQGKQKLWLPSNFRVDVQGLSNACRRIGKVDALSVKQKVTEVPTMSDRNTFREPASIEYPNLVVSLPEADAEPFYEWFEDFVIKGNCTDQSEKTGNVEYLSPDLKTVLLRVDFDHLGIFKITPDKSEAGANAIRRVKIEMYCEVLHVNFEKTISTWA